MLRVRFAPSPTGYLHIGSARTFIFNWLYARRNHGTMILRIDDTDVDRNTQASLDSIFDGLKWLDLDWDEQYAQSERGDLHRQMAWAIFEKGLAYRDFTSPRRRSRKRSTGTRRRGSSIPACASFRPRKASAAPMPASRLCCGFACLARARTTVEFHDAVYGEQSKLAADIEDFALLRSNGVPTYHMASCADDVDLRISHIIRGQDHLTNTFKHVLIFEALGAKPPQFAHLPLLIAPDGSKLSKRRHGPVVSVLTYRDAGFLPHAYINFLCLLGWSPKDNREQLTRQELMRRVFVRGHSSPQRGGEFHRRRSHRSQSHVAERRADPHAAGGGACGDRCCRLPARPDCAPIRRRCCASLRCCRSASKPCATW